jgi:MFS family permease
MSVATTFRALTHRNFRLYLAGQGVSVIGSWMQQVAMAWLVYQLTGSPLWLGIVAFAGQIPALFLTPLGGSLIDRCQRKRLLYLTQSVAMAQAFVLAALTLTGMVEPWHVVALSLVLGTVNALDIPTRQSFLSELVGNGNDLANAIALNSSVFNGARLIGPAFAALMLALTSPGVCFLANSASYVMVLLALAKIRLPQRPWITPSSPSLDAGGGFGWSALSRRENGFRGKSLLGTVAEGLAYAWQSEPIRSLLILIGLFNLAGMAEMTLLPIVSTTVLHGDASTLGFLSASAGLGAFSAAVLLATRRNVASLAKCIIGSPVAFGLGMIAFSFVDTSWAAAFFLVVTGFSLLLMTAGANTVLQTIVEEGKRGRVMSLYTTAVTGLAPLGGLLAGLLADQLGAPYTLRLAGVGCLAITAILAVTVARTRTCGCFDAKTSKNVGRSWSPGMELAVRKSRITASSERLPLSAAEGHLGMHDFSS